MKPATAQEKVTTFILVRHAEKEVNAATMQEGAQSKDPELSDAGKARALRLADMLQRQEIAAIYSTNYKRTLNTVNPLAEKTGIKIQQYEPFKEDAIVQMMEDHRGKTIVIVGHSNNIPWIANLLLGTKQFGDYDESYYENLLVVTVVEKGVNASTLQIKY
jgi:broad specificity phosphatase PhoE